MAYNDDEVNELRKRLWVTAFKYARELRARGDSLSGLELIMAFHQVIEETRHHWVEDRKSWDDILAEPRERR